MNNTKLVASILILTSLFLTACKNPNVMTEAEANRWRMQHPFNSLPVGTIVVDENGKTLFEVKPQEQKEPEKYNVEENRKKILDKVLSGKK